jgi:F-type H+-transporting ATPase subunit O
LHGLEGRYATALFSAASKQNALEQVEKDLSTFKTMLISDSKVKQFLETPTIDRNTKQKGLDIILGLKKHDKTTGNFFKLLAENGRLNQTIPIIDSYSSLMSAYRGEVPVVITTAKAI